MKIAVGNTYRLEEVKAVRTPEQREAVKRIIESDDFDFACNNPFTDEVRDYKGPFAFMWYTTGGELLIRRIGKKGNILL